MKQENEPLTPPEALVIEGKGTEAPFTGKYDDFFGAGTYHCRRCGAALYNSTDKFDAHCGWPAFDESIPGAVRREPDADGVRTEIICAACGAHLGHVFTGEHLTEKNTRHCVNSISVTFVPNMQDAADPMAPQIAVLASGCFWGTEYWLSRLNGVIATEVGYAGGWLRDPLYRQVKAGDTGHLECVRVVFDPNKVSYEEVLKMYFNTFDFEQADGQGPDIGPQYRSAVFYTNLAQKNQAEQALEKLREKGYKPVTQVRPLDIFYPEHDEFHRRYYDKKKLAPYCHSYREVL